MKSIDCTLIADGTSDIMIAPAIKWCLAQHFTDYGFNMELARLGDRAKRMDFAEKVCFAIEQYPCSLLFIHRDTEKQSIQDRLDELQSHIQNLDCEKPTTIFVIPKRMSEAWLLIEEEAIRYAANNPSGKMSLHLPPIKNLENIPDPKTKLIETLMEATGLSKRRLKKFKPRTAIHHLSEYIEDYSPLRQLDAFKYLEEQISELTL